MQSEHRENSGVDVWAYLKHHLHVTHKCGHPAKLAYGSSQAAEDDRVAQEGQLCFQCQCDTLMGAPTSTIDPDIEVRGVGDVYLNITHSCGHEASLLFGSYEAAAANKARFLLYVCAACFEKERARSPMIGH